MGESGILLLIFLLLLGTILAVSIVLIWKAERERDEALQHVADARTDFLSRISNDIKTPMNVIMGMMRSDLKSRITRKRWWNVLEKSIRRAGF